MQGASLGIERDSGRPLPAHGGFEAGKEGSPPSGGCRGVRKAFSGKGRQESHLEAEQAEAWVAGVGGGEVGRGNSPCTGHRAREGPRLRRKAKRLLGQEHSILTAEEGEEVAVVGGERTSKRAWT